MLGRGVASARWRPEYIVPRQVLDEGFCPSTTLACLPFVVLAGLFRARETRSHGTNQFRQNRNNLLGVGMRWLPAVALLMAESFNRSSGCIGPAMLDWKRAAALSWRLGNEQSLRVIGLAFRCRRLFFVSLILWLRADCRRWIHYIIICAHFSDGVFIRRTQSKPLPCLAGAPFGSRISLLLPRSAGGRR